MKNILVIGSGISGLSAAFALSKQAGAGAITVIDKSKQVGGWLKTYNDGRFFFELGPRVFKASTSEYLLKLIQTLGLETEVISSSSAARRFILHEGNLCPVPNTIFSFCTSPLTRSLIIPLIKERWIHAKFSSEDESVAAFIQRRFGKVMLERIIDPIMQGIYAQDPKELSSQSCLPTFVALEQKFGSIVRGMLASRKKQEGRSKDSALFTLKPGMSFFVDALTRASKLNIRLSEEVLRIEKRGEEFATVTTKGTIYSSAVIIATDCHHASSLLSSLAPESAEELSKISSTNLTTIAIGFNDRALAREGFGYLVPSHEKGIILGTVFDSSAFPQQNAEEKQTRLTLMLRGLPSKEEQRKTLEVVLRQHLKIVKEPDFISSIACPRAIPIMAPGHKERIAKVQKSLEQKTPGIYLAGNYLSGPSVNDCIKEGEKAASSCLAKLRCQP